MGLAGVPQDVTSHEGLHCLLDIYLWQVSKEKTTGSLASLSCQLDFPAWLGWVQNISRPGFIEDLTLLNLLNELGKSDEM